MLVGRDADVALVADFVLGRTHPRYPVLLVTGEAGMGKTALLDAVVPLAQAQGIRVLRSGGVEFEADLVFGGLNQLLLPLVDGLPDVSTVHREALEVVLGLRPGEPGSQLVVGAAVLALVGAAASTRLVFVVDDATLLDLASAMAIAYVARRVDGDRVRFLLATRTDAENAFVRSGFDVHVLGPLDDAGADALLAHRFPDLPDDVRSRVRDAARGNPLALLDLPADLDLGTAPLPEVTPLADRLRAVYGGQLARLPPATREALLLVALSGAATGAPARRLVARVEDLVDLGPAERLGLVRVERERVDFRHPLIRATVVESSGVDERRRAHATLADTFRDEPRRRAWHLGHSAVWPAPSVAAELEELSDELLGVGDSRSAISAVLRAAELTEDRSERARRLGRASFLESVFAGDLAAGEELLRRARPDPSEPLPLSLVTAGAIAAMSRDGDTPKAHRLLSAALDALTDPLDGADRPTSDALHLLVLNSYVAGRADLWVETRRQLARARRPLPEALAVPRDVYADAAVPSPAALRRLDDALGRLAFTSDVLLITRLATAGAHLDRGDLARTALERVVADGRGGGAVARQAQALFQLALADWSTGSWDLVEERVTEGLRLCEERGYVLLTTLGVYLQGLVDAARGRDGAADRAVEALLQQAAPRGLRTVAEYASHVQCLRAIGDEQFDEAYRQAISIGTPGAFASTDITSFWTVFDVVEAAWRSGHEHVARAHVAAATAAGLDTVSPRLALVVRGSAALVAEDDWSDRFAAALAVRGADRFAFDHARVRLAYGERLRRERLVAAAREELGRAAVTFDRLGAVQWRERAERELRAAGGTTGRDETVLTAQEQAIARLAADGLTNKQIGVRLFLSPRTVSTHLSHVFAKLGVASRHDLDAVLEPDGSATSIYVT